MNIVDNMSHEMYLRLKHAVETGKWPEGNEVGREQLDSALQLTMAYQKKHLDSDQMLTIGKDGHMVNKSKRELKEQFKADSAQSDIARFTDL